MVFLPPSESSLCIFTRRYLTRGVVSGYPAVLLLSYPHDHDALLSTLTSCPCDNDAYLVHCLRQPWHFGHLEAKSLLSGCFFINVLFLGERRRQYFSFTKCHLAFRDGEITFWDRYSCALPRPTLLSGLSHNTGNKAAPHSTPLVAMFWFINL